MTAAANELIKNALKLPVTERQEVADILLETVHELALTPADWEKIERARQEIRDGQGEVRTVEEFKEWLRSLRKAPDGNHLQPLV